MIRFYNRHSSVIPWARAVVLLRGPFEIVSSTLAESESFVRPTRFPKMSATDMPICAEMIFAFAPHCTLLQGGRQAFRQAAPEFQFRLEIWPSLLPSPHPLYNPAKISRLTIKMKPCGGELVNIRSLSWPEAAKRPADMSQFCASVQRKLLHFPDRRVTRRPFCR